MRGPVYMFKAILLETVPSLYLYSYLAQNLYP